MESFVPIAHVDGSGSMLEPRTGTKSPQLLVPGFSHLTLEQHNTKALVADFVSLDLGTVPKRAT